MDYTKVNNITFCLEAKEANDVWNFIMYTNKGKLLKKILSQ